MKLEYRTERHESWKPLKSTNMPDAARELDKIGSHTAEAHVRNAETGMIYIRRQPLKKTAKT